jgi:hypothetical protein
MRAASAARVADEFDVPEELRPGVTRIAFYDFVILCGSLVSQAKI